MDIRKYFKIQIPSKSEKSNEIDEPNKIEEDSLVKTYRVYTDGSTFNNGKKNVTCVGGFGVFFGDNDSRNISHGLQTSKVSNNVAELMACKSAILQVTNNTMDFQKGDIILICTDSQYMIDSIEKWSNSWESNGWKRRVKGKLKPVKNLELIKEIKNLYRQYNVRFKHVKAHQVEPMNKTSAEYRDWYGNKMADKLAIMGSKQMLM